MHFWGLLALAVAALILLLSWLCYWAFTDPEIEKGVVKDQFRAEQDWRALRRSGKL